MQRQLIGNARSVALLARDKPTLQAAADEIAGLTGRTIIGISANTGDDAEARAAARTRLKAELADSEEWRKE